MLVKGLGGCSPAEDLSWSSVEGSSDGVDLLRVPAGQVGALGEVLAQEAVGVLVRAALPWAAGVGEVDGESVSTLNSAWAESSLPRSQVSDRRS